MELSPLLEACQQHLNFLFADATALYPDGQIQIQLLWPDGTRAPVSRYFPIHEIEAAAAYAVWGNIQGYNTYVGVNPRKPSVTRNATDDDVEIAFYQFADLDDEESVNRFRTMQNKPVLSFKVITGDVPHERFHLYYRLTQPCHNMKRWQQVQQGLIDFFGSDPVIKDLRRIMRIAGTASYPSPDKLQRGYIPCLVRLENAAIS